MDVTLPPPLMVSQGFLPTDSLLESLIQISNEVASMEKTPTTQSKNVSTTIRRIKILSSLFQEIQETNTQLPPSSILCLTELYSVIRRVKSLIQECKEGSCLWNLVRAESISNQFYVIVKEMSRALDILPLSLLKIAADTREQVELLHKQVKRVELLLDSKEVQRRDELLQVMMASTKSKSNSKAVIDFEKLKVIMSRIGLKTPFDYEGEISKLEAEAEKEAGTGGLIVVSNINNLISLVSLSKSIVFSREDHKTAEEDKSSQNRRFSFSQSMVINIPDEYRCPISLDLMRDPVIVASGHSYDRVSIAQWINSGHHTCPKSGKRLIHMALIPNFALKSLIHQYCEENNLPVEDPATSSSNFEKSPSVKRKLPEKAIDHISATKSAMDAVKMTAEFLVGKLAMGSLDIQRQAAYELRLLAKTGMDNRRLISEAGAIPFLVTLLSSHDSRIQEHAVTALLNLSIFENNKVLIVAAGAIDSIVDVLGSGKTMEARENAAAAIFSLSIIDDYKVIIGSRPKAIPALVGLLKDGTTAGKRDAATALINLAVYSVNKVNVVVSGAVPLLIDLLMDDKAGITDDALAVLSLLLGCCEGREEIRKSKVLVPILIDLLRFGSPKGKENSITLLLGLCKDGNEEVARRLLMNPRSIPSLQSLAADGSMKAQRKADALLRLLNRCSFLRKNRTPSLLRKTTLVASRFREIASALDRSANMEEIFADGFGNTHTRLDITGEVTMKAVIRNVVRDCFPKLSIRQKELFRTGAFGQFLDIPTPHGDNLLVHTMMLHEVRSHALARAGRFGFNVQGINVEYGSLEFCLITGLKFGPFTNILGGTKNPKKSKLRSRLFKEETDQTLRLSHIENFILGPRFEKVGDDDAKDAVSLQKRLEETTGAVTVIEKQLKEVRAVDMELLKNANSELDDAKKLLEETKGEEISLREAMESLKLEVEDVKKEVSISIEEELNREKLQTDLEQMEVEFQQAVTEKTLATTEAEEIELKIREMLLEAEKARAEEDELKRQVEKLWREAQLSETEIHDAETNLEVAEKEVEEAQSAKELANDQMRERSCTKEVTDSDSDNMILLSTMEFEALSKVAEEALIEADTKVEGIMDEVVMIRENERGILEKLEKSMEEQKEIEAGISEAVKSAKVADEARKTIESELRILVPPLGVRVARQHS
ncbi:hypothetical protein LXL04_012212 [Taraxacum kok-saghyz]